MTDRTCREIGFLRVSGHRVPQELSERLYALSMDFFRREASEKMHVAQPASDIIRGYIGQGRSALAATLGESTPPDLKESFSMGPETPPDAGPYYAPSGAATILRPTCGPRHPRAGETSSWSIGMRWGGFRPRWCASLPAR